MSLFLTKPWILVYDDGDGDGDGGGGSKEKKGSGEGEKTALDLKTLVAKHGLQEELNNMMASNRKGLTQRNTELVTQLQKLSDQTNMSTQAKDELEARIEELQTQFMSKEELTKRESEKLSKTHAKEVGKLTSDTKKWQGLYATSTTQRAIMDAAVAGEALPQAVAQIIAILGQRTHIVEELDGAGQGKGTYKTIVKFSDVDSDGKPVVLDLSPKETIKRMKELPNLYGNLFKGDATGGLGGTGGGTGKSERPPKLQELLDDPVKYAKWRKDNPDLPIEKLGR